jgi:DNA helicase-2/ATP-dependent DNA helicase PcrA
MTRAREWLALSAHLKVNVLAAPVSPYILEVKSKYEGELSHPKPWVNIIQNKDEPDLHITYSELSAYLECGYSYWLRNLLGFPPAIVEEIGYGKAIHHLMRSIAEETKKSGKVLNSSDIERILATEFFLPYANKAIATRFKDSARNLVHTYLNEFSADMERVWEVERPFELALPGIVVSGRADVILEKHDGELDSLAIVDYKTSIDDRELGLQLQVYAAAGLREGLEVKGAFLHDLEESSRQHVDISKSAIEAALKIVSTAAKGIKERKFDAQPEKKVCGKCDVKSICKSAILK